MKKVVGIHPAEDAHWVGNGFHVRTPFIYANQGQLLSPFLMLDYAAPEHFSPSERRRGVGKHPHRGFETVTLVYQGDVEHRDSIGNEGTIGPGDVQWMTAASGIVHEEWHAQSFTRRGGTFELAQLWVNLPAKDKMSKPRYQDIRAENIPTVSLTGGVGMRVIAGEFQGVKGPALTFSPIHVWDAQLTQGQRADIDFIEGFTALVCVLKGEVLINGTDKAEAVSLAMLDRSGQQISLEATTGAAVLILSGQPLDEPIAGYGPFVMNTQDEIVRAIHDFQDGRMG